MQGGLGLGLRQTSTDSIGSVQGDAKRGIGMTFKPNLGDGILVSRVKPGSAAEASGRLRSGDKILSVDGVDCTKLDR